MERPRHIILAIVLSFCAVAQAQRNQGASSGPEVEESSRILNLFRNAEQAADRSDWKLAIDSIQRILESPEGLMSTMAGEGLALYESPRRRALRYLAGLPPEALEAYRLLYDGRAKGLLDQARRDHDLALLREIGDRYLLTRYGMEASRLLVSWLLDSGRAGEALLVIEEVESIEYVLAVTDVARTSYGEWSSLKSAALSMVGDEDGALEAVNAFSERVGSGDARGKLLETALRRYVLRPSGGGSSSWLAGRGGDWPAFGGGGSCRGVMSSVEPSFAENMPWRQMLSPEMAELWSDRETVTALRLPVSYGVAQDGWLYVRASDHCVAVDLQSFSLLWRSRRPDPDLERRAESSRLSESDILEDYVSGGLSVGHGLVLSIERGDDLYAEGAGDGAGPRRIFRQQQGFSRNNVTADYRNRIVALDALTGEIRWQRGRDQDADERLQGAQFLAVPVAVGSGLWVPYRRAGDLYLGVLRPEDGGLVRETPLCTLGSRSVHSHLALHLAVADGLCFVPTGQGLLFAVNTHDGSIRWASRYGETRASRFRGRRGKEPPAPKEWLTSVPIVTGKLVILASPEDGRVLAFDRFSGALLWSMPSEEHHYLIGADETTLWLGGLKVSALSLADQVYQWTAPLPDAMGRASLCGETIYGSTRNGLVRIDARTGQDDLIALPEDQAPLGNLLCIGDSMVSVNPVEVRSFPDRNSFASTQEAHRGDPSDVRLGMRLAFMELLNRNPRGAMTALEQVVIPDSAEGDTLAKHVAHLRVDAMLQLASLPTTPIDESLAYLAEANRTAIDPKDRVSARLSLGDRLRRVGRNREAYESLLELSQGRLGDEIVVDGPVRRPARLVAADVLRRIEPELSPGEVEGLSASVGAVYELAIGKLSSFMTRREGVRLLKRMADGGILDGWSQSALNALGVSALDRGRFERAEQYFLESVRMGSNRGRTAEAMFSLVELYLDSEQGFPGMADAYLQRLESEYSGVAVEFSESDVVGLRARLSKMKVPRLPSQDVFEVLDRSPFSTFDKDDESLELLAIRGDAGEVLRDRMLVFEASKTLRSYAIDDGTLAWESELLLLGSDVYGVTEGGGAGDAAVAVGVVDGETIVMNGPEGVHALGAVSGVRLWAVPAKGASLLASPALRSQLLDAGSGRVACVLSRGVLSVRKTVDGGQVVWERDLGHDAIGAVRVRDSYVLTADPEIRRVKVYALADGDLLSDIEFRQPAGAGDTRGAISIAYSGGVLCGPDGTRVVAYDCATGLERWRLELGVEPAGLFEPSEGWVVVSSAAGKHWLVDMDRGDVVFERDLDGVPTGATMGVMDGGVMDGGVMDGGVVHGGVMGEDAESGGFLTLAGFEKTTDGLRWDMVGLDAKSGEIRWEQSFYGTLMAGQLKVSEVVVPILREVRGGGRAANGAPRRYQELRILDKRSGEYVGSPVVWEGGFSNDLKGPMGLWGGRLAIGTEKGIAVFETSRLEKTGRDRVD